MSVPVLIGFAGVLVAAVATGMLAGLCARRPRIDLVLWTAGALGLTVALAAQSMGFAEGFGPATFLAIQLSALLLVPLWLSWGLVELAGGEVARFGMRLASGALTSVAGLIVATDPLTAQPFSKSWPLTGPHSQPVSVYALDAVQAVAVIAALAVAGLASRTPGRLAAVGPIALAVLLAVGLRASFPVTFVYPLLSMMAVALVWFGVSRAQDPPGPRRGRRHGAADGVREDVSGSAGPEQADPGPGRSGEFGTSGWYGPDGAYDDRRPPVDPRPRGQGGPPGGGYRPPAVGGAEDPAAQRRPREPGQPAGSPPARPYGRILIFTLLEDKATDFDRLAEQAAEQVRTGEPDTLVYVIHLVPNAPLQRIFYEIYRDRGAFESHENQPYMKRFVADRRSCVLATNSIELRLKYAKVAPLPNPQPAGPVPAGPIPAAPGPGQIPGAPGARPPAARMPGTPGMRPQRPPRPPQPQPLAPLPPDPRGRGTPPADPRYRSI